MQQMPRNSFADNDLEILRQAKATLEHPGLAIRLASLAGKPFDRALRRLPAGAHRFISDATEAALRQCLVAASNSLGAAAPPGQEHRGLHRLAVGLTGAAGGAFGLSALAVELPVTTTIMFRSILAIARSAGEDVASPDTRLQCLTVLALGGPSSADDDAEAGYFAVRAALAELVSKSAAELSARGLGVPSSSWLLRLIQRIAQRFSVQVGQQAAAKSIPILGAVLGAAVNTAFMEHFQAMATAHFTLRQLERKYGREAVERQYGAI